MRANSRSVLGCRLRRVSVQPEKKLFSSDFAILEARRKNEEKKDWKLTILQVLLRLFLPFSMPHSRCFSISPLFPAFYGKLRLNSFILPLLRFPLFRGERKRGRSETWDGNKEAPDRYCMDGNLPWGFIMLGEKSILPMLIFRVVSFPKRISSEVLAWLGLIAEHRSRSNNRSLSYVSLVLRATGEWEKSHKTPKSWIVFFSPFCFSILSGCEKSFLSRVGHAWSGESIREHGIDRGGPERFLPRPTVCSPESWWVPSNPILHGFSPGEKKAKTKSHEKKIKREGAGTQLKEVSLDGLDNLCYFILLIFLL